MEKEEKKSFNRRQFIRTMGLGAGMLTLGKVELALAVLEPKGAKTNGAGDSSQEIKVSDEVYRKMAKVLDTLPQGFPSTESGVELKILKFIFEPDEADLFCDLKLTWETAQQISQRTGRPLEGLEAKLLSMAGRGEIWVLNMKGTFLFRMIPWAIGIYELSTGRMDKELAALNEEYLPVFIKGLMGNAPSLVKTLPIEEELPVGQKALPYQKISEFLEIQQSFMVVPCHCKKQRGLVGKPCTRSTINTCMAISPMPNAFDNAPGKVLTREEARALLTWTEENALVHTISNLEEGHFFICNCCSCCCGMLKAVNELGVPASDAYNSDYHAVIDKELCAACGKCADERCQVKAITAGDDAYEIKAKECIGCGLCVSTCPEGAISLVKKPEKDIVKPPKNEMQWLQARAKTRCVDFSKYI